MAGSTGGGGSEASKPEGIRKSLSGMFDMMAPLGKGRKRRSSSDESGGRRRGGRGAPRGGGNGNGKPKDPVEA